MVKCMSVCNKKVNKSSLPFRAERRRREARRQACIRPEVYTSRSVHVPTIPTRPGRPKAGPGPMVIMTMME